MIYDVIIIGSGIAGLNAALKARKQGLRVAVLSKSNPFRSSSAVASGGINAVLPTTSNDSIMQHIEDTIYGSDGLVQRRRLARMCSHASHSVEWLESLGVQFDRDEDGVIEQRPFGGSKAKRTCHIADKTGAAIVQKLYMKCREEGIKLLPNYMLLNIVKTKGRVSGITVLRRADSMVIAMACKSLVLAGGGFAGIYKGHTTNAQENSGDVLVTALRAGLTLTNMEFMQFHPTTLKGGTLISEAARGEGGHIIDETGVRFTDELATRDKLSRAILDHIDAGHDVFLDLRHLSKEQIDRKLPSVKKSALLGAGVDIHSEPLSIIPAAHYSIGGIWCRGDASTQIEGIFVCGEAAASGVHGANRLGGNSLLEGAVFGEIAGESASTFALNRSFLPIDYQDVYKDMQRVEQILVLGESSLNVNALRTSLGQTLFKNVGVFKDETSLIRALEYTQYLNHLSGTLHCINKERENNVELALILELKNAFIIAEAMILSALKREESRGVHHRIDFPEKSIRYETKNSYVRMLKETYLDVSFSKRSRPDWIYKIQKLLHLR